MTDSAKLSLKQRRGSIAPELAPIYICIAGFCLSLVLNFPGFMSFDSVAQIIEARSGIYSDWHPPAMAFLWHFADKVIPGPFGMLFLDTALIWIGTCLVTTYWFSNSRPACLLFAPFLLVFYPPIFSISGAIWKDIFMAGLLICAIGIAAAIKPGTTRAPYLFGIMLMLLYGAILFRYNAVFAVTPIVVLGILQAYPGSRNAGRIMAASILAVPLAFAMLLCMKPLNDAITSHKCSPWQQIAFFDIAGTIHNVHELPQQAAIFERVPLHLREQSSLGSLLQSYSSEKYNTLVDQKDPVFQTDTMTVADRDELMRTWCETVVHHPLAWLRHRWQFFLHLTGFSSENLTSPVFMEPRGFPPIFDKAYPDKTPELNRVQNLLKAALLTLSGSVLFRPWIYLLLALLVLVTACLDLRLPYRLPIVFIAASALTHEMGLLISAPSPDFRYSHYMIYASMLAATLFLRSRLRTNCRIKPSVQAE